MILSRILNKNYLTQHTDKELENISKFLSVNNYLYNDDVINIDNINEKEALYSFSEHIINIPDNFYKLDKNYLIFESIQKHLGDKTLEFIIKHEFGHLNHHQFLSLQHNIHSDNFEYITLNSNSNYIKTNTSLDKLFDRTLSNPNPIEDFIHMNFMESYADSYAGFTSYLQDKDKTIFAKIHNLRLSQFKDLKDSDNLTIKQNANNSIAEIYSGKLSTSRYSNYLSSKYIEKNIIEQFSFNKLKILSIYDLHNLIQIEVLSSLQETLKKEIKNNPLFNKQFNDYLKTKNMFIADYFKEFNHSILEYKEQTYLNIIHSELLTNNQNKFNQFINFHANNTSFQSSNLFNNFLTTQEEQDLYRTIQTLKNNDKLEQNKEGLSKYLVDKFILPKNNFLPLIQFLMSNNKSNQQYNEIIKSLNDDTKQYLLNSYNGNSKIKIEPLPQLQNHSQQQLIKIFTESLSDKNKKEFNNIVNQFEIKEISTPYLSSSFNAHVLTNEQENNLLKSKKECLLNIDNIRNKCLILSNNNSNQHKIKS